MTAASTTPADPDLVETSAPVQKDDAMADDSTRIELSRSELREVAGYAVTCAQPALAIFERERPADRRPRAAIGKQLKLSASQRKHLLELHDARTHTQEELAELFSVSRTTVHQELQRRAATASS